ncbi:hypothetical protein DPMN_132383 [Dreissena polymorpha]|uniref:Uncharacterized protein n=1 Tax=Dreissena polymorpha TaxID=45954 RepID=A0A9D4FT92_DREPO|nr:hypothetical protein DPMN_132383 [Dreissena polymorpha]
MLEHYFHQNIVQLPDRQNDVIAYRYHRRENRVSFVVQKDSRQAFMGNEVVMKTLNRPGRPLRHAPDSDCVNDGGGYGKGDHNTYHSALSLKSYEQCKERISSCMG